MKARLEEVGWSGSLSTKYSTLNLGFLNVRKQQQQQQGPHHLTELSKREGGRMEKKEERVVPWHSKEGKDRLARSWLKVNETSSHVYNRRNCRYNTITVRGITEMERLVCFVRT